MFLKILALVVKEIKLSRQTRQTRQIKQIKVVIKLHRPIQLSYTLLKIVPHFHDSGMAILVYNVSYLVTGIKLL